MRSLTRKLDPTVGIYFSHYECFGHTSRVAAIGEIFKKRFPHGNLFFIQAGLEQPKSKIDQLGEVFTLPSPFMSRSSFKESVYPKETDLRSKRCQEIITRHKPDLFITEFFPLGREECRHELIPSLIQASKQGAQLWAITGYPLLIGTDNEWRQKILKFYQKIIVLSPAIEKKAMADSLLSVTQRQKYSDFFKENEEKIVFAGYLLPQQEVVKDDTDTNQPKPPMAKGACQVAVIRGGGAVYPKVIAEAIRASDLLGKEYYFTVVAGPSTTTQEWYFFATLIAKKRVSNLILLRSLGNYEGLIEKSDVCVSLASYHSSVMLLKHQKKAVIVPFVGYEGRSHAEQPARAVMLKKMLSAQIIPYQELTAVALAQSIKKISTRQAIFKDIPKGWFTGAKVLEKHLTALSLP